MYKQYKSPIVCAKLVFKSVGEALKKTLLSTKKTSKQNLTIPVIPDYYLHFVSINHEKKIEEFIDVTSDCKFRCILCLILENRIKQLITRTNELYDLPICIFNYTFNTSKLNVFRLVNTSITVFYTQKMQKIFHNILCTNFTSLTLKRLGFFQGRLQNKSLSDFGYRLGNV